MNKFLSPILCFSAVFALSAPVKSGFVFKPLGNYPNSFQTYPRGLNRSATVVGVYQPMGGFDHGYVQTGKTYQTIEPPGALSSYLEGINDKGSVVGGYCDTLSCNPGSSQHGYLFSNGRYTVFNYPGTGYSIAPQGINNRGQVVGGYCSPSATCPLGASPSNHAFRLDQGIYTTLDYPAALGTLACAINDFGAIVGYYEDSSTMTHGYMYESGSFLRLDFPNANWTIPLGINNLNTISGIYEDNTTLITHGFTYANGVFTRVDVPNSTATGVGGINNNGYVTATANVNNVSTPFMGIPVR